MQRGSINIGAGSVPALALASQAEAQAGTNNTRAMTPLRVAEAISALGGGGGGSKRVQLSIQGYTMPGEGPTPASGANGLIDFSTWGWNGSPQTIMFDISGTERGYTLSEYDPTDGTIWLNKNSIISAEQLIYALKSSLEVEYSGDIIVTFVGSYLLNIATTTTGSSSYVHMSNGLDGMTTIDSNGTDGSEGFPASGEILSAETPPPASGKCYQLTRAWLCSTGNVEPVHIGWKNPGGAPLFCAQLAGVSEVAEFQPETQEQISNFFLRGPVNQPLVMWFPEAIPDYVAEVDVSRYGTFILEEVSAA